MAHAQATFDGSRTYQGRGGDIHFTVTGDPKSQSEIHACLRWKVSGVAADWKLPRATDDWSCGKTQPLTVSRIGATQDAAGYIYSVTIPRGFADPPSNVEANTADIPEAELAIFTTGASPWQEVRDVGITSRLFASLMAIFAVLLAGTGLYQFAKYLGVPGPAIPPLTSVAAWLGHAVRGFSVPLRIISSAKGWASLSQLQIVLWTFVVGAGAVYVMSLTWSLVSISSGTLALLGIAGGATVLTEIKSAQQGQASATLAAPGAVTDLVVVAPASANEVRLRWSPPGAGGAATTYVVQYSDPATPDAWHTASIALRETAFRIVGLTQDTAYSVRVIAANAAGNGPPTARPAPTIAGPALPVVADLRPQGAVTGTSVSLAWTLAGATSYTVKSRPHDGDADWSPGNAIAETTTVVGNLKPDTPYDFRVTATAGAGPAAQSAVVTVRTGTRVPRWSDIVTDTDKPAEIDVTRVQMLFFTVISAVFVAMNIIDTGTIPAIDPTYVTLMGISNGVYLSAKFVRN